MHQPGHNPFQAPIEAAAKGQMETEATSTQGLDFVVIAKKWERYRLVYNGILILETVVLGLGVLALAGLLSLIDLLLVAVAGAVAVNFFFLLGPALDGYCQWIFDSRSRRFGQIIFVLGTLFSMSLAGLAGLIAVANVPTVM